MVIGFVACKDEKYQPVCRNWQTRQTQNLLSARVCGFESHHRHQTLTARKLLIYRGLRAFLNALRSMYYPPHISRFFIFRMIFGGALEGYTPKIALEDGLCFYYGFLLFIGSAS